MPTGPRIKITFITMHTVVLHFFMRLGGLIARWYLQLDGTKASDKSDCCNPI